MNGARRIQLAHAHEHRVASSLRRREWLCEPFGQAMLSEAMRRELRAHPTPLRWLPDLIGAHRLHGVVLFDAKAATRDDTPNHSLEASALEAADIYEGTFGLPDIFVWPDGSAATPTLCREIAVGPFPGSKNGSGTPYYLIPKDRLVRLADVLPRVDA